MIQARQKGPQITRPMYRDELDCVIGYICQYFNTNMHDLKSKSRKRELVIPRHIAIYLSYKRQLGSKKAIGKYFSRDHSTVIHAIEAVSDLLDTDSKFRKVVEEVNKIINDRGDIKEEFIVPHPESDQINTSLEVYNEVRNTI